MLDSLRPLDEDEAIRQLGETTASIAKTLATGRDLGFSSRKLSALFGESSECIFLKDRSTRIVYCNECFNRYYARQIDSPIGLIGSSFLPAGVRALSESSDDMLVSGCHRVKLHHDVESENGDSFKAITVKLPLLGPKGCLHGIIGISKPLVRKGRPLDNAELQRLSTVLNGLREEEKAVAKFVCDGVSNKHIARRLDAPLRTVENRRRNVLKKLGLESTAQLIKLMVRLEDAGLIQFGV